MLEAVEAAVRSSQPGLVGVPERREPAKLFEGALSDQEGEVSLLNGYWELKQKALFVVLPPGGDAGRLDHHCAHVGRFALVGAGRSLGLGLETGRFRWD